MTVEKLPPRRPFWQLQRERGNEGEKLKLTAIKLSHRCRTQAVRKPSTRAAWRGLEYWHAKGGSQAEDAMREYVEAIAFLEAEIDRRLARVHR